MSLPQLREAIPASAIRFATIPTSRTAGSASIRCPIGTWRTRSPEPRGINPRPLGEATIFRLLQPYTIGFLTYSEGCNDDVNKAVWSGLGWNPDAQVIDILREFGRYYIGDRYADDFAQGLLALERNWQGPLLTNAGVYVTLEQFQAMEKAASPEVLKNWRFQQALYRAYYDAYVRARLIYETELEERAMDRLARGRPRAARCRRWTRPKRFWMRPTRRVAADWRTRVFELADDLFASIKMQTSVPKYKAIGVDRGATLDTIDVPLNNRLWLKERFAVLRAMSVEAERLARHRRDRQLDQSRPGRILRRPGQARLAAAPGRRARLRQGSGVPRIVAHRLRRLRPDARQSWKDHAESLLEAPLRHALRRSRSRRPTTRCAWSTAATRRARKFAAWPTTRSRFIR